MRRCGPYAARVKFQRCWRDFPLTTSSGQTEAAFEISELKHEATYNCERGPAGILLQQIRMRCSADWRGCLQACLPGARARSSEGFKGVLSGLESRSRLFGQQMKGSLDA